MPRRPLPDSEKAREQRAQRQTSRWALAGLLLLVAALLVLLFLLFFG